MTPNQAPVENAARKRSAPLTAGLRPSGWPSMAARPAPSGLAERWHPHLPRRFYPFASFRRKTRAWAGLPRPQGTGTEGGPARAARAAVAGGRCNEVW